MRKNISIILILFVLVCSVNVVATEADGGLAGAFLQVPAGARPAGMGNAYIGVSNDAAAPLFNPAGVANLKRPLFGSSFRAMKLDRTLGYITFIAPVQGNAVLGVNWLYAGSGSVEARDSDGDLLGFDISNNNHQFSAIFAKRFEKFVSLGANLSYLYSTMPEFSAVSVGFDIGAMLYVDMLFDRTKREDMAIKDIRVGAVVKNISKEFQWNSEEFNDKYSTDHIGIEQIDKFPIEFGLGSSARFLNRTLLLSADAIVRESQSGLVRIGGEYTVSEQLSIRSGYNDSRFTAGAGFLFKLSGKTLLIDYAFSTDKVDEGSDHIFSIDLQF